MGQEIKQPCELAKVKIKGYHKNDLYGGKAQVIADDKRLYIGNWSLKYKDVTRLDLKRDANRFVLRVSGDGKEFQCFIKLKEQDEIFYDFVQKRVEKKGGVVISKVDKDHVSKATSNQKSRSQPSKRMSSTLFHNTRATQTINLQKKLKRITPEKKVRTRLRINDDDDERSYFSTASKKVTPDRPEAEGSGFDALYGYSTKRIKPSISSSTSTISEEKKNEDVPRMINDRVMQQTKDLSEFFAKSNTTSSTVSIPISKSNTNSETLASESPLKTIEEKTVKDEQNYDLKGFSNLGNTCYINSTLQCLFSLKSFFPSLSGNSAISSKLNNVFDSRNVRNFIPLGYNVREQRDCHEYLVDLLDQLEQDGEHKTCDLFAATVTNSYTCLECGNNRKLDEHYNHFSIDIGSSSSVDVTKSLSKFFNPTDNELRLTCETCKHESARHSLQCTKWPSVLILQLKRFRYNSNGEAEKVLCNVSIPHYLSLGDIDSTIESPKYRLSGMIEHKGQTSLSGHYTANIRLDNEWYRCNDSLVTALNDDIDYSDRAKHITNDGAYVLMYESLKVKNFD